MTRVPMIVLVAAATLLAAGIAAWVRPGRADVLGGAALGTAVAGGFAALALHVVARIRRSGGEKAATRMVNAFVGLMLSRMVGYLALVLLVLFFRLAEPVSVCLGLVGGTLAFTGIEIMYLRKLK